MVSAQATNQCRQENIYHILKKNFDSKSFLVFDQERMRQYKRASEWVSEYKKEKKTVKDRERDSIRDSETV